MKTNGFDGVLIRKLFGVALALRIIVAFWEVHTLGPAEFSRNNELVVIASHVAAGEGFSSPYANVPLQPTAQQPPVYPVLLALFMAITPHWLALALLFNALVGATIAVLLLRLGRQWAMPEAGMLAAWVWALWPYAAVAGLPLTNYGLCGLLLLLGLLAMPRLGTGTWSQVAWLGVGGGIAALVNPTLLMLAVVIGVASLKTPRLQLIRNLTVILSMAVLVLIPWTVRNYVQFDRFIPVRDNFGLELWIGNYPEIEGTAFPDDFPATNPSRFAAMGETAFFEAVGAEARTYIRQEPGAFLGRTLQRIVEFWSWPTPLVWGVVSLLAWAGAVLAVKQRAEAGVLIVAVLLLMPAAYYVTHVGQSYRHAIEPLMLLSAAHALVLGQRWWTPPSSLNPLI